MVTAASASALNTKTTLHDKGRVECERTKHLREGEKKKSLIGSIIMTPESRVKRELSLDAHQYATKE